MKLMKYLWTRFTHIVEQHELSHNPVHQLKWESRHLDTGAPYSNGSNKITTTTTTTTANRLLTVPSSCSDVNVFRYNPRWYVLECIVCIVMQTFSSRSDSSTVLVSAIREYNRMYLLSLSSTKLKHKCKHINQWMDESRNSFHRQHFYIQQILYSVYCTNIQ